MAERFLWFLIGLLPLIFWAFLSTNFFYDKELIFINGIIGGLYLFHIIEAWLFLNRMEVEENEED